MKLTLQLKLGNLNEALYLQKVQISGDCDGEIYLFSHLGTKRYVHMRILCYHTYHKLN